MKNPKKPTNGASVRQWEAIGMSRASWYRHGKPTEKPHRNTQKDLAKILGVSVRTIQRDRAEQRAEFVAKVRAYMAKGHGFEEAFRLVNAEVSKSRQVADKRDWR